MVYIREEGSDLISVFIIDRVACGFNYEMVRGEFETNFKIELTKEDYNKYINKYEAQIKERYTAVREEIYNSGAYHKLLDISDTLYKQIKTNEGTPKEISTLAATLRGYLESMSKLGNAQNVTKIKQQNNFVVLKTLERDGLISINDDKKVKYLVDGGSAADE